MGLLSILLAGDPAYRQSVEKWRADRENRLKADDGWLTLVGLHWLNEGRNSVGSADTNRVQLPSGFPANAGIIERRGTSIAWQPARGARRQLATDKAGKPDTFEIGRLQLHIIERGPQFGVRIRDRESEYRRKFTTLRWFPVREDWRVKARFISYPVPRKMEFEAQAGGKQEMMSPGYVEWQRDGRTLRLTPVTEGDQLFFVFRDKTAGKTTYPAARFLYSDPPKNGVVELDFNKAYNPPCVFTPYATCPLPPPENRLAVTIEAGEMMYENH